MADEILVQLEQVSKKFSRSLRMSLWYGLTDVLRPLNPLARRSRASGSQLTSSGDLELRPSEFLAVRDVSFTLRRGECLGLIGHNGAGKSTLLKLLNGLIAPDGGCITVRGRAAALIDLSAGFNPILTGRENIFTRAALLGFTREETAARFDDIVEFADIGDFLDMPVQNYSSGMRVRLGFAVSAEMDCDVLVIDEVLAVGDAAFRHKCLQRMAELRERTAMILVSHSMPQIYRICSHIMVMKHGEVAYFGDDVGEGIQTYYHHMETREARIIGGDTIDIQNVRFESGGRMVDEKEPISVDHGDELRISFRLLLHRELDDVGLKLSFWNQELQPVLDVVGDGMTNYRISMKGQNHADVQIVMERMLFNTGRYTMSIVATDESLVTIYGRADNLGQLVVRAPYPTGANQITTAQWSVTSSPPPQSIA